jgi:hypothetical protein
MSLLNTAWLITNMALNYSKLIPFNLHFFPGICGRITELKESYRGVTYNITSLYSDLKFEEDTAQTACTLIQLIGSKKFSAVFYKDCQQGYKFSASTDLKYTLNKVLANREWTYEKVLERTENSFTAPIVDREAPSFKISTDKVAGFFQVIVITIFFIKRNFMFRIYVRVLEKLNSMIQRLFR